MYLCILYLLQKKVLVTSGEVTCVRDTATNASSELKKYIMMMN